MQKLRGRPGRFSHMHHVRWTWGYTDGGQCPIVVTTNFASILPNMSCITYSKIVLLNQNWNQSDPDLYPETQQNFLATGLIPNCESDLYQFYKNRPKTCYSYRPDTGYVRTVLMLLQYWFSSENMSVTELFGNGTVLGQKIFGCNVDDILQEGSAFPGCC